MVALSSQEIYKQWLDRVENWSYADHEFDDTFFIVTWFHRGLRTRLVCELEWFRPSLGTVYWASPTLTVPETWPEHSLLGLVSPFNVQSPALFCADDREYKAKLRYGDGRHTKRDEREHGEWMIWFDRKVSVAQSTQALIDAYVERLYAYGVRW